MRKKIAGMDSNVFFVGLTSFLTDTTSKMIYSVMPLFLISLGASKTELSLIEGIAESTSSVLKAVSGWWSDRIGRNKPFMVIGYAFTALLSPLFAAASSPLQVLAIRFTERVGKGIRTAPRDSLVAGSAGDLSKGKSFGFHKAMDNSGRRRPPARLRASGGIPRAVQEGLSYRGDTGCRPCVLIAFVKRPGRRAAKLPTSFFPGLPSKYYFFLAIIFVFTLGNSTDALLLVKAGDVGIPDTFIPIVYLIFNSVSVAFAVPIGSLSDRIGRERLIIFGYVLYSLIYLGFALSGSPAPIVLLFALYGLYSASTDGVQKALVTDIIDKRLKGTGLGIYDFLVGITLLPASLIAGILYDMVDNRAPFLFGSAMAIIAAAMLFIFYRYNRKGASADK